MARLMLPVVSPDAPLSLARHLGWRRPTLDVASPDASACVARSRRDSRPTLSDLSPDTRRSDSRGLQKCQSAAKPSNYCEKWESESPASPSWPSAGDHPTPLAISVDRLGRLGLPTGGTLVDRLGLFGRPTRRLRWTDRGTSVDRLRRLGLPTLPPPTGDNSNCRGLFSLGI